MSSKKKLLENLILPLGDFFMGSDFIRNLKKMRAITKLSEDELVEIQAGKLRKLLEHASEKSPYYRNLKIMPQSDPTNWLLRFPVLDKNCLKKNDATILTSNAQTLLPQYSSGSSGIQSKVYWSKKEQSIHRATQILWWEWAGYNIGDPIIQTGLSFKRKVFKRIKDQIFNTKYILAFAFDKNKIIPLFQSVRPDPNLVLAGYASSLYDLALIAKEGGIQISFKTTISWGDKLFPHYRKAIEQTFQTRVHETYGTTEGMMIAAQKDLDYMYIMTPNVFLEILDDNNQPVPDGEIGHVVVTNLNGFEMPLIRFKIGDLAIKLPKNKYPPYRELALPLLQKVIGRDTDVVKTPRGKTLIVHSFTGIFEYIPEIQQFCVIQEKIDSITIQFIPGTGFHPKILHEISSKISEHLKEPFQIEFEEVKFIEPTPSGKPQLIISRLPK